MPSVCLTQDQVAVTRKDDIIEQKLECVFKRRGRIGDTIPLAAIRFAAKAEAEVKAKEGAETKAEVKAKAATSQPACSSCSVQKQPLGENLTEKREMVLDDEVSTPSPALRLPADEGMRPMCQAKACHSEYSGPF